MMPVVPPTAAPRRRLRPRSSPDLPPLRATRVLDQLRERLRLMHYSQRTEETSVYWVKALSASTGCGTLPRWAGPRSRRF